MCLNVLGLDQRSWISGQERLCWLGYSSCPSLGAGRRWSSPRSPAELLFDLTSAWGSLHYAPVPDSRNIEITHQRGYKQLIGFFPCCLATSLQPLKFSDRSHDWGERGSCLPSPNPQPHHSYRSPGPGGGGVPGVGWLNSKGEGRHSWDTVLGTSTITAWHRAHNNKAENSTLPAWHRVQCSHQGKVENQYAHCVAHRTHQGRAGSRILGVNLQLNLTPPPHPTPSELEKKKIKEKGLTFSHSTKD